MLDTRKDLNFTSFNIEKSFAKNTNGIYSKFPYNKIRTFSMTHCMMPFFSADK